MSGQRMIALAMCAAILSVVALVIVGCGTETVEGKVIDKTTRGDSYVIALEATDGLLEINVGWLAYQDVIAGEHYRFYRDKGEHKYTGYKRLDK